MGYHGSMLKTLRRFTCVLACTLVAVSAFAQTKAPSPERAELNRYEKNYTQAKAGFQKSTKNAKAKQAYVDATVALGTKVMTSSLLAPKEKYPRALKLYREALKLDPKNKEALENKAMIEQIYKSMGRPIPQ